MGRVVTYDEHCREKRFTYWALSLTAILVIVILSIPDGLAILPDL